MCDGFITNKGGKDTLCIELKDTDVEVLKFIRDKISPDHPIKKRSRTDQRTKKTYHSVLLHIMSKSLISRLNELGIVKNKTGKEIVPYTLPDRYIPSFTRGVIDGDGCFYIGNNGSPKYKRVCLSVCSSSKKFLKELKLRCFQGLGKIHKRKGKVWATWQVENIKDIVKICNNMYNDDLFSLIRKKVKFEQIKKLDNK